MRDWWEDLRDNWDNPYWRLDHPEITAVALAVITGAIGLLFAWLQAKITQPTKET